MIRNRSLNLVNPTVATHFPSISQGGDLNTNVHMFTEDVHLAVMPIGGRTHNQKSFSVSFEGEQNEREKAVEIIGEIGRFDRHDLAGMVCDAVEEIARLLSWDGCSVFELIKDDNENLHVYGFTTKNLVKLPGYFLQIIPRGDWKLWKPRQATVPRLYRYCNSGGRAGWKLR